MCACIYLLHTHIWGLYIFSKAYSALLGAVMSEKQPSVNLSVSEYSLHKSPRESVYTSMGEGPLSDRKHPITMYEGDNNVSDEK